MLENLQKHSTPHTTFQPNSQVRGPLTPSLSNRQGPQPRGGNSGVRPCSRVLSHPIPLQIGEEMSQNSFIKQYLEKQQELLQQRLEREAREAAELEGECGAGAEPSCGVEEWVLPIGWGSHVCSASGHWASSGPDCRRNRFL